MKKNDFNKILIAMFTAFMICLMSFLTAFGCFKSIQQDDCVASASIVEEDYNISSNDTAYYGFVGSPVFFYRYQNNDGFSYFFSVGISYVNGNQYITPHLNAFAGSTSNYWSFGDSTSHSVFNGILFDSSSTNYFMGSSSSGQICYAFAYSGINGNYNASYNVGVRGWYFSNDNSGSFGEIVGFDYGCIANNLLSSYDWIDFSSSVDNFVLSYFDSNGNRLCFSMSTNLTNFYYYYPLRTYLFSNDGSVEYSNGYNNGYNVGVGNGYDNGYNVGVGDGYDNGYNVGFAAGINTSNPYTFLALLTAVVDAPVQVFSSLFDWNFLGFNLKNFFLSLITICVILIILKYVLGGAGGD